MTTATIFIDSGNYTRTGAYGTHTPETWVTEFHAHGGQKCHIYRPPWLTEPGPSPYMLVHYEGTNAGLRFVLDTTRPVVR